MYTINKQGTSETFRDSAEPEMLQSTCVRHIDRPRCNPQVCHEQRGRSVVVSGENGEGKIHPQVTMAPTMSALHRCQMTCETVDRTSLTCFHVPADEGQTTEFSDETQSTQLQLHPGPCWNEKYNTTDNMLMGKITHRTRISPKVVNAQSIIHSTW